MNFTDQELCQISNVDDLEKASSAASGSRVLILGIGDLAEKKAPWIQFLDRIGVDIYAADINHKPHGLDSLGAHLKDFIVLDGRKGDKKIRQLAKEPFEQLDIMTWAESHLLLAIRHQDIAKLLTVTKPLDTNLELARNIYRGRNDLSQHLVSRLRVHDHYGGRWVLNRAAMEMPDLHATHGFINEIQLYIVESKTINDEPHRIDTLKAGICRDLLPHAFRMVQALLPDGATWVDGGSTYTRKGVKLKIIGGGRDQNKGAPIADGIETFCAVGLRGEDFVSINGNVGRDIPPRPFNCLMVVGKGLKSLNHDPDRDTKGIMIRFQTGGEMLIDLDSQRIVLPDNRQIRPPDDILHRGINLPMFALTKANLDQSGIGGVSKPPPPNHQHMFQTFGDALTAMKLVEQSRKLPWLGHAYEKGSDCAAWVNQVPRTNKFVWQLKGTPPIQLGEPPEEAIVVP